MDARIRRAPPVPHRRLVLLLLAEGELVTGWRSSILSGGPVPAAGCDTHVQFNSALFGPAGVVRAASGSEADSGHSVCCLR